MKKRLIAIALMLSLLTSFCMFEVFAATLDTASPYTGEYILIYNTNKNTTQIPAETQSTGTINASSQMFSMQMPVDDTLGNFEEDICDIVEIDGEERYVMEYTNPLAPSFEEIYDELNEQLAVDTTDAESLDDEKMSADGLLEADPMMDMELIEAPISFAVGDTRSFQSYDMYLNKYYSLNSTCRYVGKFCEVWVENVSPSNGITNAHASEIGTYFDSTIQPLVHENFGSYISGSTSNGIKYDEKIIILLQDIHDPYYYERYLTSPYVAGYFDPADLLTSPKGTGNKTAMIHISIDPLMKTGSNILPSKSFKTLAHEFQHLVNYTNSNRKWALNQLWINEAFSLAVEHMLGDGILRSRVNQLNNSYVVQQGAALCYDDYNLNQNDLGANYGLNYLFIQYLRIQTKNYPNGGDKIFKLILSSNYTDYQAVEEALTQIGYPVTNFDEVYRNYMIALVAQEPTGIYGFDAEVGFDEISFPLHPGKSSLNLKATAATIVKTTKDSFTPSGAGPNIRFCGFTPAPKPKAPTPTANKSNASAPLSVPRGTEISLSCELEDATILYTMDGSDPRTSSSVYAFNGKYPITILFDNTTVKAAARRRGYTDSDVATFTYTIPLSPYSSEIQTFECTALTDTSVSLRTFVRGQRENATTTGLLFFTAYDDDNRLVGVSWTTLSVSSVGTYTTPMNLSCSSRPTKAKAMFVSNNPSSFEPLTEMISITLP